MKRLPKVCPKILLCALAFTLVLPLAAGAQDIPPVPQTSSYSPQQIDQMIAPIALYPDALVGQILMAATYPLEVVEADRWLQNPQNAQLRGDQLAAAADQQPWDPSVKSLVSFPQILKMMDGNLQWTEELGDAFLAQQPDVMNEVQHLRQLAQQSGHLASTPQETVAQDDGAIEIVPANPEVVYVPYYNPMVVYGAWPYPGYQPVYFAPYPGYGYVSNGWISFGIGFGIIGAFWGWDHWDWHHHRIDIDDGRFAAINHGQPPIRGGQWEHDPAHRHGVPYASPAVRQHYQGVASQERSYRGYAAQPAGRGTYNAPAEQHTASFTPMNANARQFNAAQRTAAPSPLGLHRMASAPEAQVPARHSSPLFESFAHGSDVKAQAQRGSYSRSTRPAPAPRAAPAARPAPAHGGGQKNVRH